MVAERAVESDEVVEVDARQAAHAARRDRVRADRVRGEAASERSRSARAVSGASRRSSNLNAVMTFGLLVGAPLGAFLAPATRPVPRSARRTPPPTLLHRDWRVFGVEVPG